MGVAAHSSLTVRDAIAWASFCITAVASGQLSMWDAYAHGAYLTLLDGLGLGLGIPEATAQQLRASCEAVLRTQLPPASLGALSAAAFHVTPPELGGADGADDAAATTFGAGPFRILKVRASAANRHPRSVRRTRRALPCAMTTHMNELQLRGRQRFGADGHVKLEFIIGNLSDALLATRSAAAASAAAAALGQPARATV